MNIAADTFEAGLNGITTKGGFGYFFRSGVWYIVLPSRVASATDAVSEADVRSRIDSIIETQKND